MHYYPHNIGDFRKDTPHLSPTEKGIYRDLLDYAYATEKPLGKDLDLLCRVCGAVRAAERSIVPRILSSFFIETEHGWEHKRVIHEIKKYYAKKKGGEACATSRWYSDDDSETDSKHGSRTDSRPDSRATPNHNARKKPITNNQEPTTIAPPVGSLVVAVADPSDSSQTDPNPSGTADSEAEKKEGAGPDEAELFLDLDTAEAQACVNRALGRPASRMFGLDEGEGLRAYARQHRGQIRVSDFLSLGRWLLAAPQYDNGARLQHDAVPDGSLLRKRLRSGKNVLADLQNQIDLARRWEQETSGKKKKAASGLPEPDWDYRAQMVEMGWQVPAELPWASFDPSAQREVIAWRREQKLKVES